MGLKKLTKNPPIFIISGPSGAGEDTVIERLQGKYKFNRVITTVTRAKRQGEREGNPYYFVTEAKFKKLAQAEKFIEWAKVYDKYRGCTYAEIERLMKAGKPIFWKVDWQGVETIKKIFPQAIAILIAPESYAVLKERLIKRGQDTLEEINKREAFTKNFLRHKKAYDYVVINKQGKIEATIEQASKIIEKHL
ncbi:MAG: guanylate kinase [Candidatus Buchananbacteria bacterium CG10_big_fil_rev_8_21_14_0_10_42_9]|uniref:Guanylate kinase n=1 Tax=Candidatus Buchananbacteria bacterium CG10_big_fil_rev_8_21_14_0_10_42_9 TaxID=1974526 RepID=A0A2H0W0U9_9BACT|nr:MAG: guanylate kinase [Candidatus Buchananbacteria bacterium CG10_big_fil_rev_8_21_14_0_10_42_9]